MEETKKYSSFSFKPVTSIRIVVFGFIILFIVLRLAFQSPYLAVLVSSLSVIIVALLYIGSSFSIISINDRSLKLQNMNKVIIIEDFEKYTTWWSYEFGGSSPQMGDLSVGKQVPISNKTNCYVIFESAEKVGFIYEQIDLGGKFPNNHSYKQNEKIDKSKLLKVWDIDNCLKKLELNSNV